MGWLGGFVYDPAELHGRTSESRERPPNSVGAREPQALALASDLGDSALQMHASYFLGQTYYAIGDFGRAAELLRWNVEAVDRESGRLRTNLLVQSQLWLARPLSRLGAFAEGRRHGEEALRRATLEGRGAAPIEAHAHLLLHPYDEASWDDQVLKEALALRVARATNHARATASKIAETKSATGGSAVTLRETTASALRQRWVRESE